MLVPKFGLTLLLVLATGALLLWRKRSPAGWSRGAILAIAAFVRVSLFIIVYIGLGQPVTSDVPAFYYPQAKLAEAGGVWNRDFISSYSPLFPYVGAALVWLWDDQRVFVLCALCLDVVCLGFWHAIVAGGEDEDGRMTDVSLTYALAPPVILNVLVGQQQIWLGAGLAASLWLLLRERVAAAGLMQGFVLISTKALAILFWPILFLIARKRGKWMICAAAPAVAVAVLFLMLQAEPTAGLASEQKDFTSGNLIYYLDSWLRWGRTHPERYDLITLSGLAAGLGLIAWFSIGAKVVGPADRVDFALAAISFVTVLFLLVSKKSYSNYLCFGFFPLLAVLRKALPDKGYLALSSVVSVAAGMNVSLWFANHGNNLWSWEWVMRRGWQAVLPSVLVEFVLLGGYVLILALSWLDLRRLVRRADD